MLASLLACSRIKGPAGGPLYLGALGIAGVAYLLAIREWTRTPKYPRQVIVVCLLMAAAWRVPFLLAPPGPRDDVLRYVWDGRLQRLGHNPYTVLPADPAVARLHTPETREMNNLDLPSPYPPGAQLFFRAVAAIHESAFAFKLAFAICDAAILLLLLAEFRSSGLGEHWALAYAWHPLVVPCIAYNGHIDVLGALLLLISAMSLRRQWRAFAAITFAMAVAVKFLPAVLAPLYWRRVRIRDGLLAALLVALLYAPFVDHGTIPLGSLGVFVQRFRFNDLIFAGIERAIRPQMAVGIAVLLGLFTAVWIRSRWPSPPREAWAWPMALSLAAAPVVYPWYLVWLLPFLLPAAFTLPLVVWTLGILPVFFVWYSYAFGGPWQVPNWALWLEYGSAAAAAIIVFIRWCRGRES
jgi:hypothetical protein